MSILSDLWKAIGTAALRTECAVSKEGHKLSRISEKRAGYPTKVGVWCGHCGKRFPMVEVPGERVQALEAHGFTDEERHAALKQLADPRTVVQAPPRKRWWWPW